MPKHVFPTITGWVGAGLGDQPTFLNADEAWDADDPFVKEHPEWFSIEHQGRLRTSRPVEQATAAPGEQRDVSSPSGEPPRGGPGSGRDYWATYAESQGVEVSDDMTRDDIIEALGG